MTIRLSKTVSFAPIKRDTPLTGEDALVNFYGYGLDEVLDSGEYGFDVSDISVREFGAQQSVTKPPCD